MLTTFLFFFFFFFHDTAPTEIYTLSLHDALPILRNRPAHSDDEETGALYSRLLQLGFAAGENVGWVPLVNFPDRKSTRLNSSHVEISYAVFCLKKKKKKEKTQKQINKSK